MIRINKSISMGISIKYGLLTACIYIVAIALIIGVIAGVDALYGGMGIRFLTPLYIAFGAAGLVIAFFAGFTYPILMRRLIGTYTDKSTDLSGVDTVKLCRLKLLSRYGLVLGCISGVTATATFFIWDEDPVLPCTLLPICFVCLYLGYGCKRRYREVRRQRFLHVLSR